MKVVQKLQNPTTPAVPDAPSGPRHAQGPAKHQDSSDLKGRLERLNSRSTEPQNDKARVISGDLDKCYIRTWELQLPAVNDHCVSSSRFKDAVYFNGIGNEWRDDFIIRHTLQPRNSRYIRAQIPLGTQTWVAFEALRNAARLVESQEQLFLAGRMVRCERGDLNCFGLEYYHVERELSLKSLVDLLQMDMSLHTYGDSHNKCDEIGDAIHGDHRRELAWPGSLTVQFFVGEKPSDVARLLYKAAEWVLRMPRLLDSMDKQRQWQNEHLAKLEKERQQLRRVPRRPPPDEIE